MGDLEATFLAQFTPPGWLSGEHVRLVFWWLWVRSPFKANFLSGKFLPLTSVEACEKSNRWPWKEKLVSTGLIKSGNMCVINCHNITVTVKVASDRNTTNQILLNLP